MISWRGVLAGAALALPLLQGCVEMAIIGGAGVAVATAEDRRTTATQLEDRGIALRAANRIDDRYGEACVVQRMRHRGAHVAGAEHQHRLSHARSAAAARAAAALAAPLRQSLTAEASKIAPRNSLSAPTGTKGSSAAPAIAPSIDPAAIGAPMLRRAARSR